MATGARSKLLLLAMLNALLLLLLFYEYISLQQLEGTAFASENSPVSEWSVPQREPAINRSIDDYAAVIARPLFNKERRPVAKEQSADSDADAEAFILVGVVLTTEQQVAIIYSKSQKRPVKVSLWGWIEGWRLLSVEAQQVSLRNGNRSLTLALQRTSNTGEK